MRHLFSHEGESAFTATMAMRPLLAFDFDGTLAPIVARPDDARVPRAIARRLERLTRILPLAIVSGRSVIDIRRRLSFEPQYIVGSHGAEDSSMRTEASSSLLNDMRDRLRENGEVLKAAGVSVEDKWFSIALHYRLARDRARAQELASSMAENLLPGLKAFGGKLVINIVAASAPDKAQAIASLVGRCGARGAVFLGDDVNDEPVFARADRGWLTVKVGRDDPASLAMFYLDGHVEVASMLDRMLVLLRTYP